MVHGDTYSRRTFLGAVGTIGAALSITGGTAAATGRPSDRAESVTLHEGLAYADREGGPPLELDLYLPESNSPAPLVVWIHGGGWLVGDRTSSPDLERYYASRGYAMATVDYRLSDASVLPEEVDPVLPPSEKLPRGTFPDQIVDIKAAIRWLRSQADEYDIDPERVATWGSSAGAHLAALAGTAGDVAEIAGDVYDAGAVSKEVAPDESGEVQAVVDWYGPTDFLQMDPQLAGEGFPHNSPGSPESILIGEQITEAPEKVQRADPITYVDSDDPPFMIMHGQEDTTVPYEQSVILFDALRENCVDAALYELHDLGHGFGFEELMQKPLIDQTVSATTCITGSDTGSPPSGRVSGAPPAGHEVIEQFLDHTIGR